MFLIVRIISHLMIWGIGRRNNTAKKLMKLTMEAIINHFRVVWWLWGKSRRQGCREGRRQVRNLRYRISLIQRIYIEIYLEGRMMGSDILKGWPWKLVWANWLGVDVVAVILSLKAPSYLAVSTQNFNKIKLSNSNLII